MDHDMNRSIPRDYRHDKRRLILEIGLKELFPLTDFLNHYFQQKKHVIRDYQADPDQYVFLYKTSVNGKAREIVTYKATAEGQMLRYFHWRFSLVLAGLSEPHPQSYAYQLGKSINSCLKQHLRSDTFLKTDIHSYFDSISYDLLLERLLPFCEGIKRRETILKQALSACFYRGHLPIGFVTSPVLSDIFLQDLDQRMGCLEGICYTRYADDFIISASGVHAKEKLTDVLEVLKSDLVVHRLELNKRKTYIRTLNAEGDAIHLLGLNIVKNESENNRITVSQRYIIETSKQIGFLLLNRDRMEPWELRRQFVSVMGKVSFIVHSSNDSALKLKKLLHIKTGYDGDLTYKALSGILLDNDSVVKEYEREKQAETYKRIERIRVFPASGRVWERASILAGDHLDRQTLRTYLFSICREFERPELGRIRINRMTLTVGDESVSFEAPWDTTSFRALIRKIRTEQTAVTYSADFLYDNGNPVGLAKHGKYWYTTKTWFRPLITVSDFDACFLYSARENSWLFQDSQATPKNPRLKKASAADFLEQDMWEGRISADLRWPIAMDKEISIGIRQALDRATKTLAPWLEDEAAIVDSKHFTHSLNIRANAQTIISVIDSLQELSSLAKQANGVNMVNAWFVPAGFLETMAETRLRYISVSTDHGRFALRKISL